MANGDEELEDRRKWRVVVNEAEIRGVSALGRLHKEFKRCMDERIREDLRPFCRKDLRKMLKAALLLPYSPGNVRNISDIQYAIKMRTNRKPRFRDGSRRLPRNGEYPFKKKKKATKVKVKKEKKRKMMITEKTYNRFKIYCREHGVQPNKLLMELIEQLAGTEEVKRGNVDDVSVPRVREGDGV